MSLPFSKIRITPGRIDDAYTQGHDVISTTTIGILANSNNTIDAYLRGLQIYNDLFEWKLEAYPQKALDLITDLLLPAESLPSSILQKALALGVLRCKIFQSADWISREQWCQLASVSEAKDSPIKSAQIV
ncbi:hypothetical protein P0Y43_04665 [Pseudomonas entomophila]|uniref:hypothetical protein n=1 Tax=Pseudomonas entomophila TaxID=312306 RepID=UPI0023D8889E|nr:hypothetical protein [Pseudomonas entomophila]MDF0730021.1 hypothetical protein [Pseudomonas entomophila]